MEVILLFVYGMVCAGLGYMLGWRGREEVEKEKRLRDEGGAR